MEFREGQKALRRPKAITILCYVIGVAIPLKALLLFTPQYRVLLERLLGSNYLTVMVIGFVFYCVVLVGYWRMRRWGLILAVAGFIALMVYLSAIGYYRALGSIMLVLLTLIGQAVIPAVGVYYFREMS